MMKILRNIPEEKIFKFCEAYNNRDLKAFLQLFSKNAFLCGTGKNEHVNGIKAIETQIIKEWSGAEKGEIKLTSSLTSSSVWAAGVFTAHITMSGTEHIFPDLRGTIVLSEEDGEWKIAHMHSSFPDTRQPEVESFPKI